MTTKQKVLTLLLAQPKQILSGETLAQQLGLSRTAIWKAIQELKKEGHNIQSKSKQGYLYLPSDVINQVGILKLLDPTVPNLTITILDTIDSTNQHLKKMAIDGAPSHSLLLAKTQENGRGRFGRNYFSGSSEGGIYMSLLLHPNQILADMSHYTIITAVALAEAIEKIQNRPAQIKWVNDIYIDNRKVAGILSEAVTNFETQMIENIIIGIGINFSIPLSTFPSELQDKAGSIFKDTPICDRNTLIASFLNNFYHLLNNTSADYMTSYRDKSLVLGEKVSFIKQQITYKGTAIDITDSGELIVKLDSGKNTYLSSGEISLTNF
ncbi:biotin--[acetyl-CoA-carboxylase] ligase [Vagococcus intermedius]|uniref:Bifunctional ligase/repressor BirA n=1 Tax=Vagococcus intermedius TaxID=2991418 RepID=A0AAF0I8U5_9ENTE|nr:biotin--[acetyl-CoA-carboxylase] ligase [Vagococcus intermedius]WEG74356.1 biotin--[acetyl-CoA-carboxylase] ligase [Vagococcus intermedius]